MPTKSLFVRPLLGNLNQITKMHFVSLSASNLTGLGGGLVLELKPVPTGKIRGYNVLWVSRLTPLDDRAVLKAEIYQTREKDTTPFYVVSRKSNAALLKRLRKLVKALKTGEGFEGGAIILEANSLVREISEALQ